MNRMEMNDFFGSVIHSYSRQQAISDGVLIDVSQTAGEAGFTIPVSVTQAVWSDYIEWGAKDRKQAIQDTEGRLWDVLYMLRLAISRSSNSECICYSVYVIPRDGKSKQTKLIKLKSVIGGGDNGEPVITIMLPNED